MNASRFVALGRLGISLSLVWAVVSFAQDQAVISLPKPRTEGGKPLMEALKERKSTREFASRPLTDQPLSDLLWAAFGVNRPRR
jgi:hypothetical protein